MPYCRALNPVSQFAPAKINLLLAITGRRADGYHDLVSLVAPLNWGDTLEVEPAETTTLSCDVEGIPRDESNLVLKAAALFRQATGWAQPLAFRLQKRVPAGAGLGGGSSDAVAALRAMNELAGNPLDEAGLLGLAAQLGADCALFLDGVPVIMRGRGEVLEPLSEVEQARLRGRRVFLFKPGFGVGTAWAYGRMVADPRHYIAAEAVEERLRRWRASDEDALRFNNMEPVVFAKYPALPTLYAELRLRFGLQPQMSGSGSASFAILPDDADVPVIEDCVRAAWGPSAFTMMAQIA